MTVALLCPTRGRNQQLNRMVSSVRHTGQSNANHRFYIGFTEGMEDGTISGWSFPDGMPTAYKWNLLAEEAMKDPDNKLFMLASDDIVFSTPLWDKALLDHYNALENKIHVYHLLDSRNPEGTPHPIVTREWIEAIGYFLPPMYLHWYVDTFTVEVAKYCGAFTHLKDYLLIHDKPSDSGKPDETHSRIRQWGWHERDKWTHGHCQHYLEFEKQRMYKNFSQAARVVA